MCSSDLAIQVADDDELACRFRELFGSEQRRAELGQRAERVITENQGATMRTLRQIQSLF